MRKPSEYIAAAVKGLRRQMPDSTGTLSFGGVSAPYTRLGSVSRGEDDITGDAPVEAFRVATLAADFPTLTKSDSVSLRSPLACADNARSPNACADNARSTNACADNARSTNACADNARSPNACADIHVGENHASDDFADIHLVTSVSRDVSGALLKIGLSYALSRHEATVQGQRGQRRINVPVSILATLGGYVTDIPDGYTSSTVRAYALLIAIDGWLQNEPPQIGDIVRFTYNDALVKVVITKVDVRDGYYTLSSRSR